MRTVCIGLIVLSLSGVAAAQDNPAPAPAVGASVVANGEGSAPADAKVCVIRTMIGSNMPRKICRSAAQARKEGKRTGLPVDPSITLDNFEGRAGQN